MIRELDSVVLAVDRTGHGLKQGDEGYEVEGWASYFCIRIAGKLEVPSAQVGGTGVSFLPK